MTPRWHISCELLVAVKVTKGKLHISKQANNIFIYVYIDILFACTRQFDISGLWYQSNYWSRTIRAFHYTDRWVPKSISDKWYKCSNNICMYIRTYRYIICTLILFVISNLLLHPNRQIKIVTGSFQDRRFIFMSLFLSSRGSKISKKMQTCIWFPTFRYSGKI